MPIFVSAKYKIHNASVVKWLLALPLVLYHLTSYFFLLIDILERLSCLTPFLIARILLDYKNKTRRQSDATPCCLTSKLISIRAFVIWRTEN